MKTREIMSSRVHTVSPTDSLAHAARLMWDHDIGFLPVMSDGGDLVGTLTDRDAFMCVYTRGIRLADASVSSAMSNELYTIGPHASLRELEILMRTHQIRRVPVVDEFGSLLGVATLGDLCSYSASHPLSSTLPPLSLAKTVARLSATRDIRAA